MSFKKTLTLWN